jgi:ribosomal protein S18 acetylase RimI-like enzyme
MTWFESRLYGGSRDLPLLIDFARSNMLARLPGGTYWKPGDVTWQFYRLRGKACEDVELWLDEDGLAGVVAFEPPAVMAFDVRADLRLDAPLLDEMLAWAAGRRAALAAPGEQTPRAYAGLSTGISTLVAASDSEREAALAQRGYTRGREGGVRFAVSLREGVPGDILPRGMRLRYATDADIAARAAAHRAAWSVWGTSKFSEEAYRELRAAPLYDERLDVILEDADGRIVSYCICWADEEAGVGHFEPVGTDAAFSRRGFGKLVVHEGLRRLRERGMHTALVGTAWVNEAARALYPASGFELVDTEWWWERPATH